MFCANEFVMKTFQWELGTRVSRIDIENETNPGQTFWVVFPKPQAQLSLDIDQEWTWEKNKKHNKSVINFQK